MNNQYGADSDDSDDDEEYESERSIPIKNEDSIINMENFDSNNSLVQNPQTDTLEGDYSLTSLESQKKKLFQARGQVRPGADNIFGTHNDQDTQEDTLEHYNFQNTINENSFNDSELPTSDMLRDMHIYDSNQLMQPVEQIQSSSRDDLPSNSSRFNQGKPLKKNFEKFESFAKNEALADADDYNYSGMESKFSKKGKNGFSYARNFENFEQFENYNGKFDETDQKEKSPYNYSVDIMNDYSYDKENDESFQNMGPYSKNNQMKKSGSKPPLENAFNKKQEFNEDYSATSGGNYANMFMMKKKTEGYGARYGAKKAKNARRSMSRGKRGSRNASRNSYGKGVQKSKDEIPKQNNFIFNQIKNEAIKSVHARR